MTKKSLTLQKAVGLVIVSVDVPLPLSVIVYESEGDGVSTFGFLLFSVLLCNCVCQPS